VTTVDASIRAQDRPWSLKAHNGLFGPATEILHAVTQLAEQGKVQHEYPGTSLSVVCTGDLRQPIVARLGDITVNGERSTGAEAVKDIEAGALYDVWVVEF
jgi:hypothetical protein